MAYDGNGTFNRAVASYVFDTVISETDMNTEMDGIATGLSTALTKDGQTNPTANLPMNSKKFTGLTAGSATTDSVTLEQVQANAFAFQGTDSGAADAYVIALSPATTTQAAGLRVAFVAANASTGASTLNAGGGADAIEYQGAVLTGAEIAAGSTIVCEHDGTAWQMTSPSALLGTVTASTTDTFTNKTIDADGTGNNLSNIDIGNAIAASQAEAEAGTDNTKLVTSLRVAQAISALTVSTVVQVVNVMDGNVATGTTPLPNATIPQITEGDEYMTLAITPTNASNKLKIDVVCCAASSNTNAFMGTALFQDTTADALAAMTAGRDGVGDARSSVSFTYVMTAGTTSSTTFRVRAGVGSAGTTTFNGNNAAVGYGGVMASSITITEYTP